MQLPTSRVSAVKPALGGVTAEDWREMRDNVDPAVLDELRREVRDEEELRSEFFYAGAHDSDCEEGLESGQKTEKGNGGEAGKDGNCFKDLCEDFGLIVDGDVKSIGQLSMKQRSFLWVRQDYKIYAVFYGKDCLGNHVAAVSNAAKTTNAMLRFARDQYADRTLVVTTAQQFFGPSSEYESIRFYASSQDKEGQSLFGGLMGSVGQGAGSGGLPKLPESVVDEEQSGGSANMSKGVSRPKKRTIQAKQGAMLGKFGMKNYRTTGVTMFNNVDELFLDKLSRVASQEVIERLFTEWKVPMTDVDAVSYAEDLLWAFMVARTASNKADYNVEFEVPVAGQDGVAADFSVFSRLLESEFGSTRRAFARGVADDLRAYLARDDNKFMLPVLAQRVGADPQMATLCFDGSTHCTNLTTSEASFTKLLEARNLFERDDVVADGASTRLMQGMSGGVRSVVPR